MPDRGNYAVFGHPIEHSRSPYIHGLFAEQTGQSDFKYAAWDVPPEQFESCIQEFITGGGKGLNCTIPLKELAFEISNQTSDRAARCGAVNTLSVREDGSLFGDNTDGVGLVRDLTDNLQLALNDLDILILGAGGATRGILGPILASNPHSVFIANRSVAKADALVEKFGEYRILSALGLDQLDGRKFDLILNATAASLSGDLPPLPDSLLKPAGTCYDLAYASRATPFVEWGRRHGATISVDGIGMLVEQAAEAFRKWRGIAPDTKPVIETLQKERAV